MLHCGSSSKGDLWLHLSALHPPLLVSTGTAVSTPSPRRPHLSQGHLFIRTPVVLAVSRCCPCPLRHLRLFPSSFRVVVCILMTLNPPCSSAFSTGASCSFGELSLLAAFSLPLLMGAPLFLDLASAGNQFTALALLFFCLQNCYFPRPPAGCWTSRIEYPLLSHFACLQLN